MVLRCTAKILKELKFAKSQIFDQPEPVFEENSGGILVTLFNAQSESETGKRVAAQVPAQVTTQVTTQVKAVLLCTRIARSREELQKAVNLENREHFRKAYLRPLIEEGFLELTIPDKPQSSRQKYRLTEKGRSFLKERE